MMRKAWSWPFLLLISTAAIGVVSLTNVGIPLPARTGIGLWFVLVCPGMALVRPFRLGDTLNEWMLAMAVSVSLATMVSSGFVYAGAWSWPHPLLVLMGLCVAGSLVDLITSTRVSGQSMGMA